VALSSFGAVILAAGRSSRMGTTKALLPWGSRSLVGAWVERFLAIGASRVAVVVGDDGEFIRSAAGLAEDAAVTWVTNPEADTTGPRESLLLGLDALPADEPAWFTPVDVPVVDAAALRSVLEAWEDALGGRPTGPLAAVPTWEGAHGHPVLAGPDLVSMLFQGERGDRIDELLAWATRRLVLVPVQTAAVVRNMNEPADYHGLAPTGEFPVVQRD